MTTTAAPPAAVTKPGLIHNMPDAVRVPVGEGHYALVDRDDLHLVEGHTWSLLRGHTGKLYAYASGTVYMHRLIAQTPAGMETDHINGDGLDNRRSNLRHATASQNRANTGKPARPDGSRHSSRFKGVSWDRSRGRWQAKITVNGLCRNLGRYDYEESAAAAYDRAALAAWGEFAYLNFPRGRVAA